ncbi:MAG: HEAT repeat domain-containing protein [Planctomycetes bacterium]|nr:HEAT repeat domain-containing protein [Planctomycetota bacterium]MBL7145627.1 HEAT repeat domain-containing protein [Phycisphaerae bacterium]
MKNKVILVSVLLISIFCGVFGTQDNVNAATGSRKLDALIKSLSHQDPAVRINAAEDLGKMRSAAKDAAPYLAKATGDKEPKVRSAAVLALFRIGPEAMKTVSWMSKTGMEPITPEIATQAFDELWETVNREYPMFAIRPEVDWDKLRRQYRPEAINAKSDTELAIIMAGMLNHLRDLHIGLKVRGRNVPVYRRDYTDNWNKKVDIYQSLVGPIQKAGNRVMWAKTKDGIGWIIITAWYGAETPDGFDDVLEEMRDTRGLIVDVRMNSGGDSLLAAMISGRFVDKTRTYLYYRHRNGPARTDLTEKIPQHISPRGPWRYDRPVIMLMGQKCLSANESFCAQMSVCPQVRTMGDHTRGSTGFPIEFNLPAEITARIPQWIAYLPDGQLFDERGVQPDVLFEGNGNSFTGNRDELMSMALERLRKEPLSATPIAGPTIQSFRENEKIKSVYQPRIVSLEPSNGAVNVNSTKELRIRFDSPMRTSILQMEWEEGGISECRAVQYNEETNEFVIPVKLQPGCKQSIVINPPDKNGKQYGFQSAKGVSASSYQWTFTTKAETNSSRKSELQARNSGTQESAKLRNVIEKFNKTRCGIKSLQETVKTFELYNPEQDWFKGLRAYQTTFRLMDKEQYIADVSDQLGVPFFVFAEGVMNHICGFYQKTQSDEQLIFSRSEEITAQKVAIADPFDSEQKDIRPVMQDLKLVYGGTEEVEGRKCYVINSFADASTTKKASLPLRQWWIDGQSNLIAQMVINDVSGTRKISRFYFDGINERASFMESTPQVPYQLVVKIKEAAKPLANGYTGRFIDIRDGSGGFVSAQWGQYGSAGRSSIGLK